MAVFARPSKDLKMAAPSWEHPPFIWMNGKLVPWDECKVHVTSGYAQRGASIFEGIRVYRAARPHTYFALGWQEHLARLAHSWRALSLTSTHGDDAIRDGLAALLAGRDLNDGYCRVTRYLGSRTIDSPREPDGIFISLYNSPQLLGKPVKCMTSNWRRTEFALPAQMKIGGNYFMLSWVRQQAQQAGADDAILLNDRDHVSEATGTAVLLYLDGVLCTPPVSDGALPSITAKLVLRLASQLGIPCTTRSIHRTELFRASAVFLAGSLDELRPVVAIDGIAIPNAQETEPMSKLFGAFATLCRSDEASDWGLLLEI
jgi:branched-chain amino acid aminotransferase